MATYEFRNLEKNEVIIEGDEWYDDSRGGMWKKVQDNFGAKTPDPQYTSHTRYRRKIGGIGKHDNIIMPSQKSEVFPERIVNDEINRFEKESKANREKALKQDGIKISSQTPLEKFDDNPDYIKTAEATLEGTKISYYEKDSQRFVGEIFKARELTNKVFITSTPKVSPDTLRDEFLNVQVGAKIQSTEEWAKECKSLDDIAKRNVDFYSTYQGEPWVEDASSDILDIALKNVYPVRLTKDRKPGMKAFHIIVPSEEVARKITKSLQPDFEWSEENRFFNGYEIVVDKPIEITSKTFRFGGMVPYDYEGLPEVVISSGVSTGKSEQSITWGASFVENLCPLPTVTGEQPKGKRIGKFLIPKSEYNMEFVENTDYVLLVLDIKSIYWKDMLEITCESPAFDIILEGEETPEYTAINDNGDISFERKNK